MALTTAEQFLTVMGDKVVGCWKVTGDGTTTTLGTPVGTIDAAWIEESTSGTSVITWSGGTITFSSAPKSTLSCYVFFIGTA